MPKISEKLLGIVFRECEARYPEEACGFVLGKMEMGLATRVVMGTNIQNKVHERDPKRYPRDAKTAYTIDAKELQLVENEARLRGEGILAIFHSHPEHEVYFSAEDKGMAAPWGEPLFPGQSYLVVSVYSGEVKGASEFYWDAEACDFLEKKIL